MFPELLENVCSVVGLVNLIYLFTYLFIYLFIYLVIYLLTHLFTFCVLSISSATV